MSRGRINKSTVMILMICGVVELFFFLRAASAEPYTMKDCIRSALDKNTDIWLSIRESEIAGQRIRQAYSSAFPQIKGSAQYLRMDELESVTFGEQNVEIGALDNYSAQVEANQILFTGGSVDAGIEAARYYRLYSALMLDAAKSRVVKNVCRAFYDVLLAKEIVSVRESSVRQLQDVFNRTEKQYENGLVSEFDLLSSKVSLDNEKPKLLKSRNNYEIAVESLRKLIKAGDDIEFTGDIATEALNVETNMLIESSVDNRYDVKALAAIIDLRKQDVRAEKANLMPDLNAGFVYKGANPSSSLSGQDEWEWNWNATVSLSWSIWDGNLIRAKVDEKMIEVQKAVLSLEQKRDSADLEVRKATLDLRHAAEMLEAGHGTVKMAEKALEIANARYNEGMATLVELKDSTLGLSEARLSRLISSRDYLVAVADLQYAMGVDWKEITESY